MPKFEHCKLHFYKRGLHSYFFQRFYKIIHDDYFHIDSISVVDLRRRSEVFSNGVPVAGRSWKSHCHTSNAVTLHKTEYANSEFQITFITL